MQGQETPCKRATPAVVVEAVCKGATIDLRLRVWVWFQRAALYVGATWLRRGCRIVGCMPSSTNS